MVWIVEPAGKSDPLTIGIPAMFSGKTSDFIRESLVSSLKPMLDHDFRLVIAGSLAAWNRTCPQSLDRSKIPGHSHGPPDNNVYGRHRMSPQIHLSGMKHGTSWADLRSSLKRRIEYLFEICMSLGRNEILILR
jgi:hypothetical protein